VLISDKQKKILTLLADGEFHSGTELAEVLGVSRSAICKQLKGLSELGLHHSAVSGKVTGWISRWNYWNHPKSIPSLANRIRR